MNYWDLGLFDWDTSTFYITRISDNQTILHSNIFYHLPVINTIDN